ncbi:uncharacterized protein LOC131612524 [Vicia villosa]|uniref:uncharacterized protein LOC131612524 n=1 Tax=Vicia villosa TaxID=3911 RepID=UPI00273C5012|nr:uncharacterized protein LOC131612524 [Vicia villosa]
MEVPDTEEQSQVDDSSPKITTPIEEEQKDEDEHMSNAREEPKGGGESKGDKPKLDGTANATHSVGTVKDFRASSTTTTTPLTPTEIENLKKTKPAEYLKAIMSGRKSSTSNSSTTSDGNLSVKPTNQILHKIRETVFDNNLIREKVCICCC